MSGVPGLYEKDKVTKGRVLVDTVVQGSRDPQQPNGWGCSSRISWPWTRKTWKSIRLQPHIIRVVKSPL